MMFFIIQYVHQFIFPTMYFNSSHVALLATEEVLNGHIQDLSFLVYM